MIPYRSGVFSLVLIKMGNNDYYPTFPCSSINKGNIIYIGLSVCSEARWIFIQFFPDLTTYF